MIEGGEKGQRAGNSDQVGHKKGTVAIIEKNENGVSGPDSMLTPLLNTLREKIWKAYANTEFKEVEIRNPCLVKESSRTDKSKYYHFHKSHNYNTNDCIQLKDTIDTNSRYVEYFPHVQHQDLILA